ncbi:hypothetical protein F4861DRAFT_516533 [Xylaria intraflava]|nr:hypothetical protein F4861DRAFT_516533 [Xylaria intraflava]
MLKNTSSDSRLSSISRDSVVSPGDVNHPVTPQLRLTRNSLDELSSGAHVDDTPWGGISQSFML